MGIIDVSEPLYDKETVLKSGLKTKLQRTPIAVGIVPPKPDGWEQLILLWGFHMNKRN